MSASPRQLQGASRLRTFLKNATARAHAALEDEIGDLASLESYVVYLRGIHAFRSALEARVLSLAGGRDRLTELGPELQADVGDLRAQPLAPEEAPAIAHPAELLGALYVLEGSALGARVLCKRCSALGLSRAWGARHLWRQAERLDNWKTLLEELERVPQDDFPLAAASATAVFETARSAMARARHA